MANSGRLPLSPPAAFTGPMCVDEEIVARRQTEGIVSEEMMTMHHVAICQGSAPRNALALPTHQCEFLFLLNQNLCSSQCRQQPQWPS